MSALDSTIGAALIGVIVASCLLGITFVQTCYYFTHQKDSIWLKALVTAVMFFDVCHQALISHTVYTYVISNYGNPAILATTVWSLLLEVLFNGATALLVQGFLTMRVWKMSNGNVLITSFCASLVVAEFGCVVVFGVYALARVHTFEELATLKTLSITVNALAAAGDISLACALVFLLYHQPVSFVKSKRMIRTLIFYTINTGVITAMCALASLVSILAWGSTFIYITFFFCLGRLYANTLLATLNVRNRIRGSSDSINTTSETGLAHLGSKSSRGNVGTLGTMRSKGSGMFKVGVHDGGSVGRHPTNISIKIDTTKEFATDNGITTVQTCNHSQTQFEPEDVESSSSKDSLTFHEMIHGTAQAPDNGNMV